MICEVFSVLNVFWGSRVEQREVAKVQEQMLRTPALALSWRSCEPAFSCPWKSVLHCFTSWVFIINNRLYIFFCYSLFYTFVCVNRCTYVAVERGQRTPSGGVTQVLSTLFWGRISHWPRFHWLEEVGMLVKPQGFSCLLPSTGYTNWVGFVFLIFFNIK